MTEDAPTVSLELASRAENLTLVRGMLGGLAEALAIDPELLDDLKTAVSEACNNVVLHAYGGNAGPLCVCMFVTGDGIGVVVRDQGTGIGYLTSVDDRQQGIGVPVMQALATETEFRAATGGGTEVWMNFAAERDGRRLLSDAPVPDPYDGWTEGLSGDAVVSLSPVSLTPGVLGRLARALAASARFSLDRFSDVYLVTDAVAALASRASAGGRIGFCLGSRLRRLEITAGPFRPGAGELLQTEDPTVGRRSPLALLTNELQMEPHASAERLRIVMLDSR